MMPSVSMVDAPVSMVVSIPSLGVPPILEKIHLVAGWWWVLTILKNDGVKVNGFRMTSIHMTWKIIQPCVETTNQVGLYAKIVDLT